MIVTLEEMVHHRRWLSAYRRRLVLTNGCFDLLHAGHVRYLEQARALGDVLVVAVNTDASVRRLKGEGRPVVGESDRAALVAALRSVDFVLLFGEKRLVKVIEALQPDVWVKGGDYTLETIDAGERAALEACGAQIVFVPVEAQVSTTDLLRRIREVQTSEQ